MSANNIIPQAESNGKPSQNGWLTHEQISQFLKQFYATQQQNKQQERDYAILALTISKSLIELVAAGEYDAVKTFHAEDLALTHVWLEQALVDLCGAQ